MIFLPNYYLHTSTSVPFVTATDTPDQIRSTQALSSLTNKVLSHRDATDSSSNHPEWFSIVPQFSIYPSVSVPERSNMPLTADPCTYTDSPRNFFIYSFPFPTTTVNDPSRPDDLTMFPRFDLPYSEPSYSLYSAEIPLEQNGFSFDLGSQGPMHAPEACGFYSEPPPEAWSWPFEHNDCLPPCDATIHSDPQVPFACVKEEFYSPLDMTALAPTRHNSRSMSPPMAQFTSPSTFPTSAPSTPSPRSPQNEPIPLHHPRPRRPISVRDIPLTWHGPQAPSPVKKFDEFPYVHGGDYRHEDSCLSSTSLLCQPVSNAVLLACQPNASGADDAYDGCLDNLTLAEILASVSHDDMMSPDSQDSCGFGY